MQPQFIGGLLAGWPTFLREAVWTKFPREAGSTDGTVVYTGQRYDGAWRKEVEATLDTNVRRDSLRVIRESLFPMFGLQAVSNNVGVAVVSGLTG